MSYIKFKPNNLTIREFVNREVYVNASHLINDCFLVKQNMPSTDDKLMEFNFDDWPIDKETDEPVEVFEWWIVSSWLGRKLESNDELIIKSGTLTIWGRTTTGQSITMDYVIEKIYENLVSFLHS